MVRIEPATKGRGGTENHLLLVDLTKNDITGKEASEWLQAAHITVNMNTVPNETRSPMVTSGLRIGTPALTTRGCGAEDAAAIGEWIADILDAKGAAETVSAIQEKVTSLCARLPVYK